MKQFKIALAIILILLFTACQSKTLITSNAVSEDTIKIGAIYPLTGPAAFFGEEFKNGILLAIEEINANGGINNKKIQLTLEDSASDPKTAVKAFTKLTEVDKVDKIFTVVSSISLAIAPLAEQKQILLFADATHPDITSEKRFVFRHSNIAEEEVDTIFRFVADVLNTKNVGIIYGDDDYGFVFNELLTKLLIGKGIEVNSEMFDMRGVEFRTQITKILETKPDTIIVVGFGSAFNIVLQELSDMKFHGNIVTSLGFTLSNTETLGEIVDETYYTRLKKMYPEKQNEFEERYRERYGSVPSFASFPYGDIYVIKQAIENAGEKPKDVADYILSQDVIHTKLEDIPITTDGDLVIETEMTQFVFNAS